MDYYCDISINWLSKPKNKIDLVNKNNSFQKTIQNKYFVFGMGKTGLSVANFLKRNNENAIYFDSRKNPPQLDDFKKLFTKENIFIEKIETKNIDDVTHVIVSPGINDNNDLLKIFRKNNIPILSDIDLYVENTSKRFVAITGTNGKSTVTELVSFLCNNAGVKSSAGGNLGTPALDLIDDDAELHILELSSFHLHRCSNLPANVAVLLNISRDHIDWHGDEESYRQAKFRVLKDASSLVFNHDIPEVKNYLDNKLSVSFGSRTTKKNSYSLLPKDDEILLTYNEKKIVGSSQLKLFGIHNYENILAALAVTLLLGLDESLVIDAVKRFEGLPHRMQLVASKGNVDYINDSKGTNVNAAIASINSVTAEVILLAGGQSKGGDFDYFAKATKNKIKLAVLFGEDSKLIGKQLKKYTSVIYKNTLEEAFHEANNLCTSGDTILLSPACASFDQFKSFSHRGDEFIRIVNRSIK